MIHKNFAMTKKDQYYVIGYPVSHSLSPTIHTAFAKETNQTLNYDFLEIKPQLLNETIEQLRQNPIVKGLSVTVPFKHDVFKLCDHTDEYAKITQAVSNITFTEKREIHGHNLDGYALILDLKSKGVALKGKNILVFGAGGAAFGCLLPLIKTDPNNIYIFNRTKEKAHQLSEKFKNHFDIKLLDTNNIPFKFDVIINATSLSLSNQLPMINENFVMTKKTVGYDLAYSNDDTVFVKWMKEHRCDAYDGKGMLFELSKEIFSTWRGVRPQLNPLDNT